MASLLNSSRSKALSRALPSSTSKNSLPTFLVPAWQQTSNFSTTTHRSSKLGRTPIAVPPGVEVLLGEPKEFLSTRSYKPEVKRTITVKGPLAELKLDVPGFVSLEENKDNKTVLLSVEDANIHHQKEMWGTSWAYLNNHITGVSEGHTAILRLVGVGYRATVEERAGKTEYPGQKFLCLKLGYTHPVEVGIPKGVKVSTPQPTRVLIEGPEREVIMSFAGKVRLWRKPEPYKGKGIFINDETIKLKQKKIK